MVPILIGALVVAIVLYIVFGRRGSSGGTRIGADGFYLSTSGHRIGSQVRYRCFVGARPHQGTVRIESGPGEIFVYTGGSPTNIVILDNDDDSDFDTTTTAIDDDGPTYIPSFSSSDTRTNDGGSYSGSSGDYGDSGSRGGESSAADAGDGGGGYPPAY